MMTKRKLAGIVLVMLGTLALSGCAGIAGPSTPTQFYRLIDSNSQPEEAIKAALGPDIQIGIGPIVIPGYADRPQIVTSGAGGRLNVDDLNHWAEPVQANIKRIMVANIATMLNERQVFQYPGNFLPARSSVQVSVEIGDMIRQADGRVLLSASWNVKRLLDNSLLRRDSVKYISQNTAADFAQYSKILSQLFGRLSADILTSVVTAQQ